MNISIALQTIVFLKAIFWGTALGVVYDIFRALRRLYRAGVGLTACYDSAFWIITLISFYVFVLTVANGEGRGYIIVGAGLGTALYFLTFSPVIFALFYSIVQLIHGAFTNIMDFSGKIVVCFKRSVVSNAQCKKLEKTLKKHFHFREK